MARRERRNWNPRFVLYARMHAKTPQQQLDHDREKYVGGSMTGFMAWVSEMKHKWVLGLTGDDESVFVRRNLLTDDAQAEFNDWLSRQPTRNLR